MRNLIKTPANRYISVDKLHCFGVKYIMYRNMYVRNINAKKYDSLRQSKSNDCCRG